MEAEGRADDSPGAIRNRLRLYHELTEPVVERYRAEGTLIVVDGDRTTRHLLALHLRVAGYSVGQAGGGTGLRFFTVYGPWGRPDMSAWIFTDAILAGRPINVFNRGEMRRDFTFIDDIVAGVLAALDRPPPSALGVPHRRYNLGNHHAEDLMRFIAVIERATNRKATIEFAPIQPGDVRETFADIEASRRDLGFAPRTAIDEGVPRFVDWFRRHHAL